MARKPKKKIPNDDLHPSSIADKIDVWKKQLIELDEEIKGAKWELIAVIYRKIIDSTPAEALDALQEIYWADKRLDQAIQTAYKEAFGVRFVPHVKQFNVACIGCDDEKIVECISWQSYHQRVNSVRCRRCRQDLWLERRRQYEEIGRERQEVYKKWEEEDRYLRTMPYAEYLKTEHWQEMRKYALKRAAYKCQVCNASGKMNVHHRTYERRGHEDIKDLTVLCEPCHRKHHDIPEPQ